MSTNTLKKLRQIAEDYEPLTTSDSPRAWAFIEAFNGETALRLLDTIGQALEREYKLIRALQSIVETTDCQKSYTKAGIALAENAEMKEALSGGKAGDR